MDTAGNDVQLAQSLIEEYLTQTQSLIDQIGSDLAQKEKDFDHLHRLAHTLKGSSATISASQLSDTARIMNEAAKAQNAPEVKKSLTEFKSRFANFKRMVTKWEKSLLTMKKKKQTITCTPAIATDLLTLHRWHRLHLTAACQTLVLADTQ